MTPPSKTCFRRILSALMPLALVATDLAAQVKLEPLPNRTLIARRLLGPAPTGLRIAQSGSAVVVSWDTTAERPAYRVYRGPDAVTSSELTTAQIPGPSFSDVAATPGTTYYYRVAAEYSDGRVGTTEPTPFTVPAAVTTLRSTTLSSPISTVRLAGPAPTNIAAVPAPTSVALTWPALFNVSGYRIERSVPAGTGPWTAVGSVAELAFTDTGLDPDTPVQYRVSADYADGRLGVSSPISTRTIKPVNPANLRASVATHVINAQITTTWNASSVAYGDITLNWDPVPTAGYYELSGTGLSISKMVSGTSYLIPMVNPGLAQYQVVAYFMNGARRFGDAANASKLEVTVGSPPVTGFGGVTYAGSGPGIVDFRWADSKGATAFKLFRSDGEFTTYAEVTNASWAQNWVRDYSSPTRGKTYYYKLVSIFPSAPIAWTGAVRIDIPTTVTLDHLTGTSPGPGTVTLSWYPLANATEFSILRGKGTDPLDWIKDAYGYPMKLSGTATTYQESGLWNGATYRYNVCGKLSNGSACSMVSVTVSP
jgi:hypothetical protein